MEILHNADSPCISLNSVFSKVTLVAWICPWSICTIKIRKLNRSGIDFTLKMKVFDLTNIIYTTVRNSFTEYHTLDWMTINLLGKGKYIKRKHLFVKSCLNCSCMWLQIQKSGRDQQKHSVGIKWLQEFSMTNIYLYYYF